MAVFERKVQDKIILDDTKPILFEFKDTEIVNGHAEYIIELYREPDVEEQWLVKHRYSDFDKLHSCLKTPTINLPLLPPKKVFGNTEKEFLSDRRLALKEYLEKLLEIPFVASSIQVRRFLDPENYEGNYTEEARQNLLIALRSGGSYEVTQAIPALGTRLRKYNFIGYPLANPRAPYLLWWSPFGPDRTAHLRDIHATLTTLLQCKHPYIVSAISCIATESGVCVIRPWFSQGSLRDYIYGVKPQFDSVLKYTNNKRRDIPIKTCAVYCRQVLEALFFLHRKGVMHGALHTGNVVIDNNICRLLDIENQVLGLPHLLRNHMTKIKKINSMEAVDIYCFGHLLYEMVFHNPLQSEVCDNFPLDCPPLCRSVLESILSTEACKNGLPTASALLTHPFFNEVPLHSYDKPTLKLSASVKESLNCTYENILRRLKEDQKKVKLRRQKIRAETILSGEAVRTKNEKISHAREPHLDIPDPENIQAPISDSGLLPINTCTNASGENHSSKPNEEINQKLSSIFDGLDDKDSPEASKNETPPPVFCDGTSSSTSTEDTTSPPSLRSDLLSSISNFDKRTLRKLEKSKKTL